MFKAYYNITIKDLATVHENGKAVKAKTFYLWFPEDTEDTDYAKMSAFLTLHGVTVLSNRNEGHWSTFATDVKRGVAVVCLLTLLEPRRIV